MSSEAAIAVEAEVVDEVPVAALAVVRQQEQAQIDTQIATAKRYPRSMTQFQQRLRTYGKMSKEIAADCFYRKPVGGGHVEGESIRFAELVATAWGNLRYGSRGVDVGRDRVTVQAYCIDLETNVAETCEVSMSILKKGGQRYGNDQIDTTLSAAQSKARRNAILAVVPRAIFQPIADELKQFAADQLAKSLPEERAYALKYLKDRLGVDEKRVLHALGIRSIEDIDVERLTELRGRFRAVDQKECTVDEAFPPAVPAASKTEQIAGKIGEKAAKDKTQKPEKEQADAADKPA